MRQEITDFLAGVDGVIEATRFEHHMLWAENRRRDTPLPWIEHLLGYGVMVGRLNDMPIFISLMTAEVDGNKILFWDATSKVVDHDKIEQWLIDNLPRSAFRPDQEGGYLNRSDAANFHNVLRQKVPPLVIAAA